MKLLIDMNLSPRWTIAFEAAGMEAVHWSVVGSPCATDREIFEYAKSHNYIIFTHDLDFGAILASTNAKYPSVIQIRTQNVTPEHLFDFVLSALHQFSAHLNKGALITIDKKRSRARVLPLMG